MTATGTLTSTYTIADIRRVVDNFAADYDMVAQATGLDTPQRISDTIHDVKLLAEKGYVHRVDIVLADAAGIIVRARKYVASIDATLWASDRPGNNLWPRAAGGSLTVVVSYTQAWAALGTAGQQAFSQGQLRLSWGPSQINLAYPGLSGEQDRRYASNGYGMERTTYR